MLQGKDQAALAPATTNAAIAATIIASLGCAAHAAMRVTLAARIDWFVGTVLLVGQATATSLREQVPRRIGPPTGREGLYAVGIG